MSRSDALGQRTRQARVRRFGPEGPDELVRGMALMADVLATTLGPAGRPALVARDDARRSPELIASAATLARRLIELDAPRTVNAGAMLTRHVAWRAWDGSGDGSATAAVIAGSLAQGLHAAAQAGSSTVDLGAAAREGCDLVLEILRSGARPVTTPEDILGAIGGIVEDGGIAEAVASVYSNLGPDAAVILADDPAGRTHVDLVDGSRWRRGLLSMAFVPPLDGRVRLSDATVLATDRRLDDPEELLPILEHVAASTGRSLLIVSDGMSDAVIALLHANVARGVLRGAAGVQAPLFGAHRRDVVEDIAALTGGRALRAATGERASHMRASDLGSARRAWATAEGFGIAGGAGDPEVIDGRLGATRAALADGTLEAASRKAIEERAGALAGASATLWVGGSSEGEQAMLRLRAEAGLRAARAAIADGVVDGGGMALVRSAEAVPAYGDVAVRAAGRALRRALDAPATAILRNAGHIPSVVLAKGRAAARGTVFDVTTGTWVSDGRLTDPVAVVAGALTAGVSGALLAVSAGAVVQRRQPLVASRP